MNIGPLKPNILAHHPGDLTIDWAQRVIGRNCPDVIVSGVDIGSVDVGATTWLIRSKP